MMSIKGGTKTWTDAPQVSALKGDGMQVLSAGERDQVLAGSENIGDHLNKIADPNWVDPSKTRRVGNPDLDKDAFMKLFLAQLKNQDPTNPMESHELAAQLAQFTSLEKLSNIDTGIAQMTKQTDPTRGYDALNLIGKGIAGDSSKLLRDDTKMSHEVTFNLQVPADTVELSVKNSAGQEVKKLVAKNLKEGANKVTWDGMLENGSGAPEGEYNVTITAMNSFGQKINAETKFEGRVSGVNFTPQGPVLMIGKQSIKLKDVKRIFESSDIKQEARSVQSKALAGRDSQNLASNPAAMGGNLEAIGMSQDFINRLEKDSMKQANEAGQGEGTALEQMKAQGVVKSESKGEVKK